MIRHIKVVRENLRPGGNFVGESGRLNHDGKNNTVQVLGGPTAFNSLARGRNKIVRDEAKKLGGSKASKEVIQLENHSVSFGVHYSMAEFRKIRKAREPPA